MADTMHPCRTLLLVDDEELILEVLKETLSPLGVKFLIAGDGALGLEALKAGKPDAVLSDIHMPKMSGFDFIRKAREEGFYTPFVFLTGFGDKEKAVSALRLGAFDFLEKPFQADQLRETVGRALNLGVEMRSLEYEVDEQVRKSNVPAQDLKKFRDAKRALLALQKKNRVRKAG